MFRLKIDKENVWFSCRRGEKSSIMGSLSQSDLLQLKICTEMMEELEVNIHILDAEIVRLVDKDAVERAGKVPDVGMVSAAAVIAELGDARRLGEKQVGAYAGLVPSVKQSGRRKWRGGIAKRGSRWLRRVLVQCALAAIKVRDSRFRMFYLRIRSARGYNVAIVALARKMLVVVHRLLVTGEEFVEEGLKPKRVRRLIRPRDLSVPFEEALSLLVRFCGFWFRLVENAFVPEISKQNDLLVSVFIAEEQVLPSEVFPTKTVSPMRSQLFWELCFVL